MLIEGLTILWESIAIVLIGNGILKPQDTRKARLLGLLFIAIMTVYSEMINFLPLDERGIILVHVIAYFYFLCISGKYIKSLYATVVYIIIITLCEMLLTIPILFVKGHMILDNQMISFVINLITLIIVWLIYHWKTAIQDLRYVYQNFRNKIYLLVLVLVIFLAISYQVKNNKTFALSDFIVFLLYFVTILGICILWQRESVRNMQQKYEEEQLKVYHQTYETILKEIRFRQHEFDNHLHNLAHLHVIYQDYDSLVEGMLAYVGETKDSFEYYPLLHTEQPVISGCLYLMFVKYEEDHVDLKYHIEVTDPAAFFPVIYLIEVINILCDNAFQAVHSLDSADRKIRISIEEVEEYLTIHVQNTVQEVICYNDLMQFFEEGYSTKSQNHGRGLCNLKRIIERYRGEIMIRSYQNEEGDWVDIKCIIKKRRK